MQSTGQTSTQAVSFVPNHCWEYTEAIKNLLCANSRTAPLRLNNTTGKNSLYHASARSDKQLEELYSVGMSFSTRRGADRIGREGMSMRIQAGFAVLCLLAAATALAVPQASKTAAARDPKLIDVQAYQKLLEQYHDKPLLVRF